MFNVIYSIYDLSIDVWIIFITSIKRDGGTFISYACRNGAKGGILEQASGIEELSNVIFVGPTKNVSPSSDNDSGMFFSGSNKHEKGVWNIYRGGEKIGTRPWDWQPVEIDPVTLKDIAEPK